ncbi:Na+/H+ antiporter NhaA [Pedobacter yulinensis]|uniref:Na(+)/H(+) antiporter NhaA n=1 Tax=Pedobacter yulinensis TaxID=2126353 RepID=A0A2T3HJJ9_9SPHI|nr:Na+/H+ antiporter NhaA [Pedobacter yulinensis]PST82626.1 Na+/H+ antiporter NhaA [Pedobacter yulinensis]
MAKLINLQAFKDFLRSGQIGGLLLMLAVAVSLFIGNSAWADGFSSLLVTKAGLSFGGGVYEETVSAWINDGLMAIFFLLVGLEIKRELLEGELSTFKKASLPVVAALGGMLVPALIYAAFNQGTATAGGWGIPMATDIAFALALISMLGNRVPASLKIFLAALAIADDLGAILVIAVFYSEALHWIYLVYAAGILALLFIFNRLKIGALYCYLIPGLFLWYFIHHSGIHATVAGVLLAFMLPTNSGSQESPLEKLEHLLNAPVNYFIMPIFALANTNIRFEPALLSGLLSPLGLGIAGGLFIGKTLGVAAFSWLAVKLKFARLPAGANWKHVIGLGMLAGIGFTMSIFISMLSLDSAELIGEAKLAILFTSVISGCAGFFFLRSIRKRGTPMSGNQKAPALSPREPEI